MSIHRPRARLPWIALAAMAGVLSVADGALACSTEVTAKSLRACCIERLPVNCGCCKPQDPTALMREGARSVPAVRSFATAKLPAASTNRVAQPVPCECRSNDPTAPRPKSDPRATVERSETGRGELLGSFAQDRKPSLSFALLVSPNASPPDLPIYLRTSRLLF